MPAMTDLEFVEVVRCPHCPEWLEYDGPDGIIPHILAEHPDQPASLEVLAALGDA